MKSEGAPPRQFISTGKRHAPAPAPAPAPASASASASAPATKKRCILSDEEYFAKRDRKLVLPKIGRPVYFLLECAFGYLLFVCDNVDEIEYTFESTEEYMKRYKEVFKFISYYRFPTKSQAQDQLESLWDSKPTKEVLDFLVDNLPKDFMKYTLTSGDAMLIWNACKRHKAKIPFRSDVIKLSGMVRGLRTNICELIDKKPADLVNAQRDLALYISRKMCKSTYNGNSMAAANSSSSFFDDKVVVVPHKFEGVFIAKVRNNDAICTKNLVPGEAVYGEELISVKNEDGTKTEYRVWDPVRSKLGAAINNGVNNIWVKPGSIVLSLGDACGTTVSHLSDLVGPDGLVYAVGFSDAVVKMAAKRSNIIPIYGTFIQHYRYRMLVSMVDAIYAELDSAYEMAALRMNGVAYLRAGGHLLVSLKACTLLLRPQNRIDFGGLSFYEQRDFNILETVELEQFHKGLAMVASCFRKLDT